MLSSDDAGRTTMNQEELEERLRADAAALEAQFNEMYPGGRVCFRCHLTVGDPVNPGCPHGGHERAGDSPLNVKLLDAALEHVKDARKLLRDGEGAHRLVGGVPGPAWAQTTWRDAIASVGVNHSDDDTPRCGTAMCLAGWADTVDGLPGERVWLVTDEQLNARWEDLAESEAIMLIARSDDDTSDVYENWIEESPGEDRADQVIDANVRGRRILGLNRVSRLLRESLWTRDEYRELSRLPQSGVSQLFDGGNSLDDLIAHRNALVRLNDWLIAHRSSWYSRYPD
jgi:hypothetical protein